MRCPCIRGDLQNRIKKTAQAMNCAVSCAKDVTSLPTSRPARRSTAFSAIMEARVFPESIAALTSLNALW